jgi:hypothetical protein
MAFFDRNREEIVSRFIDRLSHNTDINQLTPGGKARFLLETIAEEQSDQHRLFDANLMQPFVKYADGRFLDFFGDMLNLPRNEATHAYTDDDNMMFYVSSGTFGDLNGSLDIIVPLGTMISTIPFEGNIITPGIEEQPNIQYATTSEVICGASNSFVYVPIRASIEGAPSDVPRNVLKQHDFTSYVLSTNNPLKCTNRYSISNGEDRESNESYRFRLSNIFKARELAVLASIRLATLSVPGVADVKEILCEQGTGTYSLYIKSLTPTTSPRLLSEVSAVVSAVSGYGNRCFVLAPQPIGVELVCAVSWSAKTTTSQIAEGYRAMRDALEKRLNTTNIGETIELSDLIDLLLQATPYAKSIGANKLNQFEEVYIYRSDPASDGTIRNFMVGTKIVPLYNERIILQTSGRHRGIQFLTR